jgi:UDP-N-acetylmuramyl pentapeptide phosphotransferase/UDP-N-acetylglucosamine-1-phosphate transferase
VVIAAGVVTLTGPPSLPGPFAPPLVATPLTIAWLVAFTNAYNFMDGIDGMAGGQALIAGAGWAAIAWLRGSPESALAGLIIAAASCGFLIYNWHPAKVFLGDAGSSLLGFLFAALPLTVPAPDWSALAGGALLGWLFLFDTGLTLARRLLRGEDVLAAHRSHMYQRLILTGMTHQSVALKYMLLALAGIAPAVLLAHRQTVNAGVSLLVLVLAASALVRYVKTREQASAAAGPRAERI